MISLRVLIADDEEPASKKMQRMLEAYQQIELIGTAENGIQALEMIIDLEPDVAFLDIEMPGLNGIEVAQNLPKNHNTQIVFCTAYQEYAVKAFELNSIDYLLKPFNKERLHAAIEKIEKNLAQKTPPTTIPEDLTHNFQQNGIFFNNKIPIPTADRYKLVDFDNIILIQVEDRVTYLITNERKFALHQPLESLEKKLPAQQFIRVNRSAIVNLSKVKEIVLWFGHRLKLILENNNEVISSREKSKILKQLLEL